MELARKDFLNVQNEASFLVGNMLRCNYPIEDITIRIPERLFWLSADFDHHDDGLVENKAVTIKATPMVSGKAKCMKILLRSRQTNLNEFKELVHGGDYFMDKQVDPLILDYRIARSVIITVVALLGPISVNLKTVPIRRHHLPQD